MTPLFDLNSLGYQGRVAALLSADAISSRSRGELTLPVHCAGQVGGGGAAGRILRGGETLEREGLRELFVFATGQIRLKFVAESLKSADGFDCTGEVELDVSIVPEAAELLALRRRLLDRPGVLTSEQVADAFRGGVRNVLGALTARSNAADLTSGNADPPALSALTAALQPDLFASGLTLSRVARISFSSQPYAAVRTEEQRASVLRRQAETDLQLRQATLAARQLQVAGVEALLQRLTSLAQSRPGVTLRDLIRTFDPAERGELYAGLLAVTQPTARTPSAVVVAGNELLWFNPAEPQQPTRRVVMESSIGPLRSVRAVVLEDGSAILVGAARGVHQLDANGAVVQTFEFATDRSLRGGVNAAAIVGGRVLATHSEIGLIAWQRDDPKSASFPLADLTRGASTIREVQVDSDATVWLSIGDTVVAWRLDESAPHAQRRLPGRVESLLAGESFVAAGLDDGRVLTWPRLLTDRAEARTVRPPTGDAVHSLGLIQAAGVDRLLIADGRPMLDLLVADDTYRVEYHAPEAVRWGWAAQDIIVGASERRDRLFVWNTRQPAAPAATIPVGRLCGHSIQDALLVSEVQAALPT